VAHRRRPRTEQLVYDAIASRDPVMVRRLCTRLIAAPDAGAVLARAALAGVERAWERGWQPRDLVRVGARLGGDDIGWLVALIARQARSYLDGPVDAGWRAQLAEMGALEPGRGDADDHAAGAPCDLATATLAVARLRWILGLVALPKVCPSPGDWAAGAPPIDARRVPDETVVSKVRALLAKAESTDYPAEAEALSAKAQELITRHAIDRALLEPDGDDEPVARRVHIDEPYAAAKSTLLARVASANGCRAVWSEALGFATVFGHRDDIDTVELLHASLLVQATRAIAALGRDAAPGARTRSRGFRRAFLFGFAAQIGERLRDAAARETAEADARSGGSLLPVLARRDDAVDAAMRQAFPSLTTGRRRTISDGAGWSAGQAAARLATLGLDHQVAPHLPS
jgi:hypothetical protein